MKKNLKGDTNMNKSESNNLHGELITLRQACESVNLGANTVRNLAAESGAVRKIGKSYRINRKIFLNYIEKVFS